MLQGHEQGAYLSIRHTMGETTAEVTAAEATSTLRREAMCATEYGKSVAMLFAMIRRLIVNAKIHSPWDYEF